MWELEKSVAENSRTTCSQAMCYIFILWRYYGGLGNQPALTYAKCKGRYCISNIKAVTGCPAPGITKAVFTSVLQLSVRRKNTKEMFGGFLKSVVKSADEVLFSGVKVRLLLSLPLILIVSCFCLMSASVLLCMRLSY